ncbi:uncharacterized protein L201_003943 [Kwoniella dendrophila CBS 6074]|uniref:EGF-like domain-containing protein n=1 Tax=Kwoniella dendrophila CBS 6074 TaxID=1295534 RepID=A0AAX4JWX6_9TREE
MLYSSITAFALSATFSWAAQVCSPDHCLDGKSSSQILAHDSSSSKFLTPGTYSDSSLSPLSSYLNITHSSDHLIVSAPVSPISFAKSIYGGSEDIWDNGNWSVDHWKSLYLPSNWYGVLEGGKIVWGAIPDKGQLPNDLTGLKFSKAASADCNPPCSSHGTCIPSNNTTSGTCLCAAGWAGESCDRCDTGFWGLSCSAGPSDCTVWDVGRSGTGKCLGTKISSLSECNCEHGTCTSSNQCVCSAGWKTDSSVSSSLCDTCVKGFFQDSKGNCSVCPLGCDSCTLQPGTNSTATCTSCSNSLTLTSATSATCVANKGSCNDGTYYDESSSSCKSCSPACSTCTGPSPSDCLSCNSPRVNLQGSCVYYDASTGICDSELSKLEGVFVVNFGKRECDACPAGCLDCSIPSFANAKGYETLQCSSCQEGYLLEDGKCVRKCNEGWFLPEGNAAKNGTCQKCDSTCSACVFTFTTCTSCPSPLFASGGSCLSSCPSGSTPINGTCAPCPTDCASCSSPTECSACPSSRPVLSNGKCVEYCPKDQYFDDTYGCQACDWTCSSCTSNNLKSCTSCPDGYVLKKGECVFTDCGEGGFSSGLGICLSSFIVKSNKKRYFGSLVFILVFLGIGAGLFYWYVQKERKKTRQATKEFGDKLDDRNVQENLRVLRLERVLGFERVLTSSNGERVDNTPKGYKEGYENKRNKRFKELLLPSRRKKSILESDIEMKSSNFSIDISYNHTYESNDRFSIPPPPYVPSETSSSASTPRDVQEIDSKVDIDYDSVAIGERGGMSKRDSSDSIPTPVLPSFISSPIQKDFKSKPKQKIENTNTTVHSMSSPLSPLYNKTSLMPPLRPGMIRFNSQEKDKEREVNRRGEVDNENEMERRLRDLWPNLKSNTMENKRRKDEGWI